MASERQGDGGAPEQEVRNEPDRSSRKLDLCGDDDPPVVND